MTALIPPHCDSGRVLGRGGPGDEILGSEGPAPQGGPDHDPSQRPQASWDLIGHADVGPQYAVITFTDPLADDGTRHSIGSVADAYDNALMKCVIGRYQSVGNNEYATTAGVDWYK